VVIAETCRSWAHPIQLRRPFRSLGEVHVARPERAGVVVLRGAGNTAPAETGRHLGGRFSAAEVTPEAVAAVPRPRLQSTRRNLSAPLD
jgi:hypothetical protein